MTSQPFCPGYPPPFDTLVASFPGPAIYPPDAFRVEWGPIFHRGRLDGTAQVLILGQDPAVQETVTRRILVGAAGQRVQGLLTRLGLTHSYVLVNTFLYSVFGQAGGTTHIKDLGITKYRNQWLTTLTGTSPVTAIITLGTLAADAFTQWRTTPVGAAYTGHHAPLLHPTFPESASSHGQTTLAAATTKLLGNWNAALPALRAAVTQPDEPPDDRPYGDTFTHADLPAIPTADLPPGLPDWMRSGRNWATRVGTDSTTKRATIQITMPPVGHP
jgi:uracil-DNA glycosylase